VTEGVNYIHLLKCREAEPPFIDIYPHVLNKKAVDSAKKEKEEVNKPVEMPVFHDPRITNVFGKEEDF
jgi:hypothetical protein